MSAVFDERELMERVDGDVEFLEETIEMLAEDSPPRLAELRSAVERGDAAETVRAAHALKGMLANFCAAPAEAAALELERMGREDRLDDAGAAVHHLCEQTERVQTALFEFLRTKTS